MCYDRQLLLGDKAANLGQVASYRRRSNITSLFALLLVEVWILIKTSVFERLDRLEESSMIG